tara:strand:- start:13302 stop:13889 length:588 start_codon:yes stop_codon:yes gene_type:complete
MDNESNLIFEQYKSVNEMIGLGPRVSKMVKIPGPGSQNATPKVVIMKISDEESCSNEELPNEQEIVRIQAGEPEESDCGGDDCGCNKEGDSSGKTIYDGELDMARLELLKANEYAAKLFHHIGNHPESDYLEGWVASKITKAADYLSSVYHYLDYEDNFPTREPCYSDEEDKEDESIELDDDEMTKTAKETGFGA